MAWPDTDKSEKPSGSEKYPQDILDEYSRDTDPRVRTSAFKALVFGSIESLSQCIANRLVSVADPFTCVFCWQIQWHQRGIQLPQPVYVQVCKALKDEYEGVRLAATKLVWVLSHLYPDK